MKIAVLAGSLPASDCCSPEGSGRLRLPIELNQKSCGNMRSGASVDDCAAVSEFARWLDADVAVSGCGECRGAEG